MKVFANQNDNDAAEEERATNEIKSSTMWANELEGKEIDKL